MEPDLWRALAEAEPGDSLPVVVHLRERADLEAATGGISGAGEVRLRVVESLQAVAVRSQSPLRAYLEGARAAGAVERYTSFWIVNAVAVRANRDTILALAARPEVAVVRLDHYRRWLTDQPTDRSLGPSSPEWGVARVRADEVWSTLNVSGTGVVVAGMDTGVDWLHPALQPVYRGYNPHGPTNHTYSWYDATGAGALYPVDGHGHGSHTMGTMVGQGGIGVAPGARWIAVKMLSNQGYGYDSWIHAGFQWLLAPGGDPGLAPDVVNNSWGNRNGGLTTFQPDLQALRAAGIFAVFSAGNNGPEPRTVSSPASLPEAFAVGAIDADDDLASFSGRGPSPWGEIRPHVVAPGVGVRSSLPGGAYGLNNGTSMAAPHVSGIAALLRSVSPTLSLTRTAWVITSTAVPLTVSVPNNDIGWGRVDALAAALAVAHPGFISGTVAQTGDGAPITAANVRAVPHVPGGGSGAVAATDENGAYVLALSPATYDVTASAFGYLSETMWGVPVTTDTTTALDFSLHALPAGTLRGHVTDAATGLPITATVTVLETPEQMETAGGAYTFTLPAGGYTVRVRRLGYRVITASVHVTAGQVTIADFALPPAPSILLVDSGPWYYGSQIDYFRQALDDLAYPYDEWAIKYLPDEVPAPWDLTPYDVVVWSAPRDAPGFVGAHTTMVGYLSGGGRLFLSGQDVGYLDGGGAGYATYYRDYLKAMFVRDDAGAAALTGLPEELFAGLAITITGPGGADNQLYPDEVTVADADAAAPVLAYDEAGCGGLRVGTCLPYRAIYLAFGFEAINDRTVRREVMDRALTWLVAESPAFGLELTPAAQTGIGSPGAVVTHTFRVRHLGQGGITDTIDLALDGASWTTQLSTASLALSPCASSTVAVSVTVPLSAAWDARDIVSLSARSSLSPTLSRTAVFTTKAPAPILLVDDDRWYDQEDKYETALKDGGFRYDYWDTGGTIYEPPVNGPPWDVLRRYPIVVWFTGYDWYRPVTPDEAAALTSYLDGGGRLFLSAQDFLYYHADEPFSRDYLGVLSHTGDVTPTLAQGVPESAIGEGLGPHVLDYPFRNWSDGATPTVGTGVPFRDQNRRAIALARAEGDHKTVFFPFPFETLPEDGRGRVIERVVGWLSWLGGSTFSADRPAISGGDRLTYTAVLRNDGPFDVTASLSNTLPTSLTLVPGSLTGPATYHPPTRRISWEGAIGADAAVTFTYQVTVATGLPGGTSIVNPARLGLEDQELRFHRSSVVRLGAPDLSPTTFACGEGVNRPGDRVTCTLGLLNAGPGHAIAATAAISLPVAEITFVTDSLSWEGGGAAEALIGTVRWAGPLDAHDQVTVSYQISLPAWSLGTTLYSVAFLEDGAQGAWERPAWTIVEPWRLYLPVIEK